MYLDEKIQPTLVTLEPWRQHLLKAADEIETYGHCKNQIRNEYGQMCFFGALTHVGFMKKEVWEKVVDETHKYLQLALTEQYVDKHTDKAGQIVRWNNAPERTGQEVIDTMRAVATMLPLTTEINHVPRN
jgi:hypothetical protein